jgi:osmotically inducible protein OsmC
MKVMYVAKVKVSGGRAGHVLSEDGVLDLRLALPKEMGGPGGGTNPEQLFAAGYAACFESAMRFQAAQRKTPISNCAIEAEVAMGPREQGGFALAVKLHITTLEGLNRSQAEELVQIVHSQICPYSNAVRGNVPVEIKLPDGLS